MSAHTFPLIRRIVGLLFGALALVGAMAAASWWSVRNAAETFGWVEHTHRVLYELETTLTSAVSIQSGVRGYALTGEERYLAPYESGLVRVQQSVARLKALMADDPRQTKRLVQLRSLVDEEVSVMQTRLNARRAGGLQAASQAVADGRGKAVLDTIRGAIQTMQGEERKLLEQRSHAATMAGWWAVALVSATAAVVAALIVLAIQNVRRVPEEFRQLQMA